MLASCLQVNNHRIPCCYLGNIVMMKGMPDQAKGLMMQMCKAPCLMKRYSTTYICILSKLWFCHARYVSELHICGWSCVVCILIFLILIIFLVDSLMVRRVCQYWAWFNVSILFEFPSVYIWWIKHNILGLFERVSPCLPDDYKLRIFGLYHLLANL